MEREKPPMSGAKQKIQEYVDRIRAGEDKESILQGLPPSFVAGIERGLEENKLEQSHDEPKVNSEVKVPPQWVGLDSDMLDFIWTIPEYVDREKTAAEKARKKAVIDMLRQKETAGAAAQEQRFTDEIRIEEIRRDIGVGSDAAVQEKEQVLESVRDVESDEENRLIAGLIKYVSQGRKQVVIDLYKRLFENISDPESRKNLISGLFGDVYNKYRIASYPIDPQEESVWARYLKSTNIEIDNRKPEWMYRGVFPKRGEETVTRGSFNVHVTPELVDALDTMIMSGKIKANYKFGQPGTTASPTERHDSISIYFLEQPSEETLQELGALVQPYVRGDQLLGKKLADGFFMSEVGSIETVHIQRLIEQLKAKDSAFADAVKTYTAPKPGSGKSGAMSEAQFYAIKDVARAFGYDVSYDKDKGFVIA